MRVKIKDRKEIAKGILQVTFDSRGHELNFKAGQFATFTLINPLYTDERGNNRFFGFSTSPSDKETFSITTRIGVSAFKKSLAELPIGTEVEISEINGRINLPDDKNQPLVFLAESIGISPIMGIMRFCNENSWPYTTTLVYINESRESTPYLDELENFTKNTQKFHLITVMTNDPAGTGEKGPIDTQFIKDNFPEPLKNLYFVTGPPQFVPGIFKTIKDIGVPIQNIKMEIFTGY